MSKICRKLVYHRSEQAIVVIDEHNISIYFLDRIFFLDLKNFGTKNFFLDPKIFLSTKTQNFFGLKNFSDPNFFDAKRSSLVLLYKPTKPKSFEPKTFQAEHFRPKSCFILFFFYFIVKLSPSPNSS